MKTVIRILLGACLLEAAVLITLQVWADRLAQLDPGRRPVARGAARPAPGSLSARSGAEPRGSTTADAAGGGAAAAGSAARAAREWLGSPEGRQLARRVARGFLLDSIYRAYGPLLRELNLDRDSGAKFASLIAEERESAVDAIQAAQAAGLRSPQDFLAAAREAVSSEDQELEGLLGAQNYQAFQQYRQYLPEEQTVGQLSDQLAGTDSPLTPGQETQLVLLLNQMETPTFRQNEDFLGVIGFQGVPLTDSMVSAASQILSPAQSGQLAIMYEGLQAKIALYSMLKSQGGSP